MKKVCKDIFKIDDENLLQNLMPYFESVYEVERHGKESHITIGHRRLNNLKRMCTCISIIVKFHNSDIVSHPIIAALTDN